jgi:hypothetical protein
MEFVGARGDMGCTIHVVIAGETVDVKIAPGALSVERLVLPLLQRLTVLIRDVRLPKFSRLVPPGSWDRDDQRCKPSTCLQAPPLRDRSGTAASSTSVPNLPLGGVPLGR